MTWLLDLTDQISGSETVQMDKFPQELVELYQNKDGKQVAIPKDVDTVALWYNKTAFDAASLAYPDETWTWDTFREAAETLTKEDGSQYGTVFSPKSNHETYYNLIYDWGGHVINEDHTASGWDDPKTIEAMEFVAGMIEDGSMPPFTTIAENEALALFESGKSPCACSVPGSLTCSATNMSRKTVTWQSFRPRMEPDILFTTGLDGRLPQKEPIQKPHGSFWNIWVRKKRRNSRPIWV